MVDDRTDATGSDVPSDAEAPPELAPDGDDGERRDDRPNWQGWDDELGLRRAPLLAGLSRRRARGAFARRGRAAP